MQATFNLRTPKFGTARIKRHFLPHQIDFNLSCWWTYLIRSTFIWNECLSSTGKVKTTKFGFDRFWPSFWVLIYEKFNAITATKSNQTKPNRTKLNRNSNKFAMPINQHSQIFQSLVLHQIQRNAIWSELAISRCD